LAADFHKRIRNKIQKQEIKKKEATWSSIPLSNVLLCHAVPITIGMIRHLDLIH